MTTDIRYMVGLVVDPAFGDRIATLAERMPTWVADTPANRAAAEALRTRHVTTAGLRQDSVTVFRVDPADSPTDWAIDVLGDIHLHHGEYSHDPPYAAIEIVGVQAEPDLVAALAEYGLTQIDPRPNGFVAGVGAAV